VLFDSNNDIARQSSASRMATDMQKLREISAREASQWADERAELVTLVAKLSRLDETMHDQDVIMQNQRATIRAFAHDAHSILTSSFVEPPRTASFQVSTLNVNSTGSASFMTAWTTAATGKVAEDGAVYLRQLFVHGIGSGTTVIRCSEYEPQFRYGHQLMVAVESRISVPTTFFWLACGGKIIRDETDLAFIPNNATIRAHYRAKGKPTFDIDVVCPGGNIITVAALKLLNITDGPTVADLKAEIETQTDVPIDQQILHSLSSNSRRKAGNYGLRDYHTLRHYKIGAARHVLSMSLVQQRPRKFKRPAETIVREEDSSEGDLSKDSFGERKGVKREFEPLHEGPSPVQKRVKWPAMTIVLEEDSIEEVPREEDSSEGHIRKEDSGESNGVEGGSLHESSFPVQKMSCKVVQERGWRRILRLGWRRPSRWSDLDLKRR
jgi:hypothetical protein